MKPEGDTRAAWAFQRQPLIWYVVIAYLVSWAFEIPIALSVRGLIKAPVPMWLHYFASFGPLVAALIVTAATRGGAGLRELLGRLGKWRVDWRYWAVSTVGLALLFAIAVVITRLASGSWPDLRLLGQPDYLPYIGPLGTLLLWFLTYGLGEETGWRGFALPHLQSTQRATTSTLILAMVWAFWHLPAFFYRDTYIAMGIFGFPVFAFSLIFAAMIFTWLYNSTRGSLLIVIVFHAVFNWLSVSEAGGPLAPTIMTIPVILWALLIPRIYGMENASPLPRQQA